MYVYMCGYSAQAARVYTHVRMHVYVHVCMHMYMCSHRAQAARPKRGDTVNGLKVEGLSALAVCRGWLDVCRGPCAVCRCTLLCSVVLFVSKIDAHHLILVITT